MECIFCVTSENPLGRKIHLSLRGAAGWRGGVRRPQAGDGQPKGRGVDTELGVGTGTTPLHCFGCGSALTKELSRSGFMRHLYYLPAV